MTTETFPGTSAPFEVLDGIFSSDYRDQTLASADDVIAYAEAAGHQINYAQAKRIAAVGKWWVDQVNSGNGEWDRMRREARELCEL